MNDNSQYFIPELSIEQIKEITASIPFTCIPFDIQNDTYDKEVFWRYSLEPEHFTAEIVSKAGENPTPDRIAQYLFFSPLIPHSITRLVFNYYNKYPSFLHYYFLAPVIDFMPIIDALSVIFSRISLPYGKKDLISIMENAGRVFIKHPTFIPDDEYCVTHLIACCLYYSYTIYIGTEITKQKFLSICRSHSLSKKVSKSFIDAVFNMITKTPIGLTFSFSHPKFNPNFNHSGMLMAPVGLFGQCKKIFAKIEQFSLKLYNNETCTSEIGGFALLNVLFISPAPNSNKKYSFTLFSEDNGSVGYRIEFGKYEIIDPNQFYLIASSEEDHEKWRSSIMHSAFLKTMNNLMDMPPWKDPE